MVRHPPSSDARHRHRVAVVGVGTVGRAIVHHLVRRGVEVHAHDICAVTLRKCVEAVPSAAHGCVVEHATLAALLDVRCGSWWLVLPTACADRGAPDSRLPSRDASPSAPPPIAPSEPPPIAPVALFDLRPHHTVLRAMQATPTTHGLPVYVCSTVVPGTIASLRRAYADLAVCHLPEFLSARTAAVDLATPTHAEVLVGVPQNTPAATKDRVRTELQRWYAAPTQRVTVVAADVTEATKLFCNAFYAAKVQLFNEFERLCAREGIDYATVQAHMLRVGWIHPMHTDVPGADGRRGFGGHCLPKDLRALVGWGRGRATNVEANRVRASPETTTPVFHAVLNAHECSVRNRLSD